MATFFQEVIESTMKTSSFIDNNTCCVPCIFCNYPVEYQFNQRIITNIHKRRKCDRCGLVFRSSCELITDPNVSIELLNYRMDQVFCSHKILHYLYYQKKCNTTMDDTKKCIGKKLGIKYVDKNFFRGCKEMTRVSILLYDMAEFVNKERNGKNVADMLNRLKTKKVSADYLLELSEKSKNSIPDLICNFMARKRGKRAGCKQKKEKKINKI